MKKLFFFLSLIIAFSMNAQLNWKADKAHSNVNFSVSHLLISEVTGRFGEFDIEAIADKDFNAPSFTVSIATKSVFTAVEPRDNHLRSDDFFAVETYPTMSFTTTSFEKTGDKTFILHGDFTLRGTTKPVRMNGTLNGIITDERSKKLKAGLKLVGAINRKDFGVGMEQSSPGDIVDLVINLEMSEQ